jgi:protein-S-isoprenylcysteine O-methyltransferase Ste14
MDVRNKKKSFFEYLIERLWPLGRATLAEHVPSINRLSGKLGWLLLVYVGPWLSALIVYQLDKRNPRWCYYTQAAMIVGAFLLVDVVGLWCRPLLQKVFGDGAYNVAFCYLFLPGLFFGFAPSLIHIITAPGVRLLPVVPAAVISAPFLIMSLLLSIKVYSKFGIDRLYYMYQYYPDEGAMAREAVYGYIRHPQYASFGYLMLGLVFVSGTIQGFFMALIILPYFPGRILPEEADLVRRLGRDYLDYRKRVPAFFPHRHAWPGFLKYLANMDDKTA